MKAGRGGRRVALGVLVAMSTTSLVSSRAEAVGAASPKKPANAPAPPSTGAVSVRAVGEKAVDAGSRASAPVRGSERSKPADAGKKVLPGRSLPPEQLARLRERIEARIDRDLLGSRKLRDEAIGLLTAFLAETPAGHREVPEALVRLAELRWEVEREAYLDRFRAWEARPVDERGPAPAQNLGPTRELLARVIRDYPRFSQMDLALYVDGFLAYEQGNEDEALTRFEAILQRYPNSRFVPDAHMAKAEALFNGKYDYQGALAEYENVMTYKGSDLYGLALFKSAWCLWRLGRTDDAAKRFVGVFEVADGSGKKVSVAQQKQLDELQSEALKYLVEVFTEDEKNTADGVYEFLTKIGGARFAGKVVRALADQFYDQAHYEQGMAAYELLLKLEPTSPEASAWMLRMAQGAAAMEDYGKLTAIYVRATKGYTEGSPWAKAQTDAEVVRKATAALEQQLRQDALLLHARAQKDQTSQAEFRAAASLYEVYLARFARSEQAAQIEYYLAEIYFYRLGDGQAAATHYMNAARAIPADKAKVEPLRTVRHDAIYNALASLDQVRGREREARKKKVQEGGVSARDESEADKKFAEALALYAELYPDDQALPDLFFRQGKQYYDDGVYDSAVRIWGSLVEKFPRSPYALSAGELILDSFSRAKDYENIEVWARRLSRTPPFASEANQRKLETLIVQAVFKQGEQKAAAGQHREAGLAYLRAAKEFPRDTRAAQACVNAAVEAKRAGDLATLKEAAKLAVSKDYRDRPESPDGAWIAATTLQSMGLFSDAAELDETIAELGEGAHPAYAKFAHGKDAAYNAVVLRVATGENDKAIANGNRYLRKYGSSADADDVIFQVGKAHQNAGKNKEAVELYRRYAGRAKSADSRVQVYVLLASALITMGDERGAGDALKSAVEVGRRKRGELGPEGRYAAAHARYMEGERVLARFEKIQIQGDVKQLAGRLKQKAELLKEASGIFLDVVGFGVAEWTTAALYQIGRTYERFAIALREAPVPSGLSEADKEQYQQQIDEFVVPIEERSLDAYENGWKKAIELQIYNPWTAKMRDALGRMNGELYPPFKEVGFDASAHEGAALPALIEAPQRAGDPGAFEPRAGKQRPSAAPTKGRGASAGKGKGR